MSIKLFSLKGVPDDEAEDVRAILNKNQIEFYETPGNLWVLSAPAIWLKNENQLIQAESLIEKYQTERRNRAKHEYEKLKQKGFFNVLVSRMINDPIQFLVILAIIVIVLYFSIKPFLYFGK